MLRIIDESHRGLLRILLLDASFNEFMVGAEEVLHCV